MREIALVFLVFVGYVGLAAWLPPVDDELYYWCWSQELQWSYYDHPAMTAVWIRASTEVFGDTVWAIRFPACLTMTAVFALLRSVTRPKAMVWAALVTPPFTFGAVLMTPDTPLLFFWALYLRWLVGRLSSLDSPDPVRNSDRFRWMVGGLLLGLGVLGKYTMALAGVCAFVSLLTLGRGRIREWLPGYFLHGVISLVVAFPIWLHNWNHDFAPLKYQWGHAMSDDEPGLKPLAEFVAVQVLLVGTLPLVLLPWVIKHGSRLSVDPRLRACLWLFALPLVFFLFKATRGPLEGNWALAAYLGFWPLAGQWWQTCANSTWWKWLTRAAFAIPAACATFVTIHLLVPIPWVPTKNDRISRLRERQLQCQRVGRELKNRPAGPVFVPTYQLVAQLRFAGVDARQLDGVSRPSHFTQQPDDPAKQAIWYWFAEFPLPAETARRFPPPVAHWDIPLTVRGEPYVEYTLWEYRFPAP